jgi:hypothetical protein
VVKRSLGYLLELEEALLSLYRQLLPIAMYARTHAHMHADIGVDGVSDQAIYSRKCCTEHVNARVCVCVCKLRT